MKIVAKNKKAYFDYEVIDTFEAGIVLQGSEIKSIRNNTVSIKDSFIKIDSNLEIFAYNFTISKYEHASIYAPEPNRPKKLLLNKKEIIKLYNEVKQKTLTIIPLEIIINEKQKAKMKIGLCRGKKNYDKRASLKEKSIKRDIDKVLKRGY